MGLESEFLLFFSPETGYLEPGSCCLAPSTGVAKSFLCASFARGKPGATIKPCPRHGQLSLPIAEDGFQPLA